LLHPDLRDATTHERLRREVRAARQGHPNLVAVYDLHEDGELLWLSMELVEGESLKQRLADGRRLAPDEAADIGRQVAAALEHLHGLGLVHRDVKPGNILLAPDGTAKLCDMGLARPLEQGMTVTATEMVVGTPAYMAPEQGLGGELTGASDVYGLGMTLYQCLAGTVPLTSDTAVATLTRRQREAPPSIRRSRPEAPRWTARLLARMLAPKPHDRPTAARVRRAIETRRVWPRPRRRTLVVAAAAAAVVAVAALAAPWLLHRETVRFEVDGAAVHGLDTEGHRTWSHVLPAPVEISFENDLDRNGHAELVLAGRPAAEHDVRSQEKLQSFVVVLDSRGAVLTRLVPEDLITKWRFPYRIELRPIPQALDLDGDGWQELVVHCQHVVFYPVAVVVYWPRWDHWEYTLVHPGHLTVITPGDGDGSPGLRFFGVNNALGYTPVYGDITLVPPGERLSSGGHQPGLSAPPLGPLGTARIGAWRDYLPLDEALRGVGRSGDRMMPGPDGSVVIGQGPEDSFHIDRFGNPLPGPNAGRDLRRQRLEFLDALLPLQPHSGAITPGGVRDRIARARHNAGPLLDEPPYRLILALTGARSLAAVGDLDSALEFLRGTAAGQRDDDLIYLEGNLLAIGGDLAAARACVLELIDDGVTARSHHDGLIVLVQIAAALGDRDTATLAIDLATPDFARNPEHRLRRHILRAWADLWWDQSLAADCELRSTSVAAEGEALACLARWRLGRTDPDDVDRMERFIELNPDGAGLGRVALAAAHLGRSTPREALAVLDTAIAALESTARVDFVDHQNLVLARALQAVALEAAGERGRAAALAAELARDQPPDLLPGILAREVLARQKD
ncbi:MAG TPA: serine/threonine-protein kinase, partial [Chondromyces sp.]|nr:serine/threonine-protein kinase [Chondromyces sp.]